MEPDGDDADILGGLQPTPRTRRVLEAAVDEARRRGHTFIGTEHLLLGLLAEPNGIAAQVLARLGAAQRARDELIAIMGSRGYSGAAASVADPALLEDLLHRSRVDQSARGRLMAFRLGPRGELPAEAAAEAAEDVRRADEENVEWLRSIVRTRGWPGRALVGDAGSEAAWLLAQHADHDPAFQRECLALLEAAVARGDASGRNLAYLTDRVLLKEGRPQRYGTQFVQGASGLEPQPLEDPERVDELRASVGLGSLSEYAEQIRSSQARRGSRPGY